MDDRPVTLTVLTAGDVAMLERCATRGVDYLPPFEEEDVD